MKSSFNILFVAAIFLVSNLLAADNAEMVLSLDAGYADNIFNDAAAHGDTYTRPGLRINFYPTSSLRLNLNGDYTAYNRLTGLNRTAGGGNVTFVKAEPDDPFSLYLNGGIYSTAYGPDYQVYNNNRAFASSEVRYRLLSPLAITGGGQFDRTVYTRTAYSDFSRASFFGGLYLPLPALNSLYVEAGYSRAQFDSWPDYRIYALPGGFMIPEPITLLELKYYRVRLSRPLGSHTGINLQFRSTSLVRREGDIFFGYSLEILSPWRQFNYGQSWSAGIKSFILPNFIISAGAEYSVLSYFRVMEFENSTDSYFNNREDENLSLTLEIQRPFNGKKDAVITPGIYLSFADNRSNDQYYDYSSFTVSMRLSVQL